MASAQQQRAKLVHLKSGGLALTVGIAEGVVAAAATSTGKFSVAEFAFAFVLTYTIATAYFSRRVQA
jgi:hypothetical protein